MDGHEWQTDRLRDKSLIALIQNIRIILVEPQGPINVGSICRLMMNFGVSDLCLVNPCNEYRSLASRRMALKAETILNQAPVFQTLEAALADCHMAFGTTRRFGKYREDFLTPEQSAIKALSQPTDATVAFVFGREDRGLHTNELDLCHAFVTIPTDRDYPSMNLSHAVALFLYELSKRATTKKTITNENRVPAQARDVENMFQHMRRTLLAAEYLDPQNPDHILRAFRRMFGRSGLDDREVRILRGLWSRIDWIDNERRKRST